jgi:AcrR family transcriptional regulator
MKGPSDYFPFGIPKLSRRQEILSAASELFSRHGVQAVTTRQIAAKVGISQPSLYAHFHSVQQIHEELSSHAFELLERRSLKAQQEGLSREELLRATIRNFFEFGMGNPVAYKIAFIIEYSKSHAITEDEYEVLDHPGVRAFANLKHVLSQVRPDLDEHHISIVSKLLWATLHGLISLLLMRSQFPWGDTDELIEHQSKAGFEFVMNYKGA